MLRLAAASRQAHTLLEMIVALTVTGIAIGVIGAFGFRQQRFHRDVAVAAERIEQLDQALALMPIALRAIAPGEGDIPAGEASDTSLEFRATIATAVICDTAARLIVLAPLQADSPRLASALTRPEAGDTAWILALSDTSERWIPRALAGIRDSSVVCSIGGRAPWAGPPRSSLVLAVDSVPAGVGSVVRITRRWRYSLYRGSDGGWYLGARDWNPTLRRFNGIQPISGPFASAAARGMAFRYSDSLGARIASGASDTRAIALIEVGFRVDTALPGKFSHAVGIRGGAVAAIALRNRAR